MPRRSIYEEDFDYNDEDYENPRPGVRKLRKEPDTVQRKKWEQEREFDRDHDYDERR